MGLSPHAVPIHGATWGQSLSSLHQIALHISEELHSTPTSSLLPPPPRFLTFHLLLWLGPEPSSPLRAFSSKNNLSFVFSFQVCYPGWNTRPLGKYKIITSLLHTLLLMVGSRNKNNRLFLVDKTWTCDKVSSLLAKTPYLLHALISKWLSQVPGLSVAYCLTPQPCS